MRGLFSFQAVAASMCIARSMVSPSGLLHAARAAYLG